MKTLFNQMMGWTGAGNIPVRARGGMIAGARWTLYPFSSYWRGTSDLESIPWVNRFCAPGGCTLDLGAHFGLYTVAMAMRVGPSGQVVSMEPGPVPREKCLRHVRLNHLDWVRVFPEAASNANGSFRLVQAEGPGSTTGFVASGSDTGVEIKCVRLDDLYSREGLRPPGFMKIDVENHGAEALDGARGLLAAHPNILMSFHSEQELSGSREILAPLGYRAYSLAGEAIVWERALYTTVALSVIPQERPAATEGIAGGTSR